MISTTHKRELKRKLNQLTNTRWTLQHKLVDYLFDGRGFTNQRSFKVHEEVLAWIELDIQRLERKIKTV